MENEHLKEIERLKAALEDCHDQMAIADGLLQVAQSGILGHATEIEQPEAGEHVYPPENQLVLVQFEDDSFGLRKLIGFDVDGPEWEDENEDYDDVNQPARWWALPVENK